MATSSFTQTNSSSIQVVRPAEAQKITALPRTVFYAKQNENDRLYYDPTFPKAIKLGVRARGYIMQELQAWIEARMLERTSTITSVRNGGVK